MRVSAAEKNQHSLLASQVYDTGGFMTAVTMLSTQIIAVATVIQATSVNGF